MRRPRFCAEWLDEAERQHLRDLADAAGVPEAEAAYPDGQGPTLRLSVLALLRGMTGVPAYVRDSRANILAANELCLALYDGIIDLNALPFNVARFVFLDGRSHGFFLDWDEVADGTVGSLRAEAGRNPLDRSLTDLIGELTARSHAFATRWAKHDVRLHRTATKRLHNSVVGDIELTGDALELVGDGLTIVAYTAEPGSAAQEKLALLGSWQTVAGHGPDGEGLLPDRLPPPGCAAHRVLRRGENLLAEVLQGFIDDVAAGRATVPIARTFAMADIAVAHTLMESDEAAGKLVVLTRGAGAE